MGVTPMGPSAAQADVIDGPVPAAVIAKFKNCPRLPEGVFGILCLNVRVHDGELKLGNVQAQITEPIEISLAIGLPPGSLTPAIVTYSPPAAPGQFDSLPDPLPSLLGRLNPCAEGVPLSGGILGMPQLDPILAADVLGVLCLSASPSIGTPVVADAASFLNYIVGSGDIVTLGVPLSIKLNNLLFGEKCHVGTPDNPITINLTNGTTTPPAPVAPISGENGDVLQDEYLDPIHGNVVHAEVTDSLFVDNAFSVPGASKCDILVGDILNQPTGLFDSVINNQLGAPSPAGNNFAKFRVDTQMIQYGAVHNTILDFTPTALEFPDTAVGSASPPQTITVTNTGNAPGIVDISVSSTRRNDYILGGCAGTVLAPGATCEATVTFTPSLAGARGATSALSVSDTVGTTQIAVTATGTGSVPVTAPLVAFGSVFVFTGAPAPLTATFTNNSASPVTVGGAAKVTASNAASVTSYALSDDTCANATIAPAGSCTVAIDFKPTTTGAKAVTLDLRAPDGGFLGFANVSGTSAVPLAAPAVAFGSVAVGNTNGPLDLVFTNNAAANPISVTPVVKSGTGSRLPSWNVVSDGCGNTTIPSGGSCTVQVTFAPDSIGTKNITLQLHSGGVLVGTAAVSGTGTA